MIHKIQYVIEKNTLLFAEYVRYDPMNNGMLIRVCTSFSVHL